MSSALQDPMNPARVSATAKRQREQIGVVETTKVYPVEEFMRIAGMSRWGFRMAKRAGLPVRTCGRRAYIRGADFAEFLASHNDT